MLQTLRVKNLAIVENIRVEFQHGLNVITGETGAGKSILVGALGLILGGRADKQMIRAGEEKCGVEATFQLSDPEDIDAILEELGIDTCEDGRLIVRRIISASGSGKNVINDCPATVQVLKRIGDLLVDMHGPHDHQSLLNRDFQLDILDSFGHLWKTRGDYEAVYGELRELERQLREFECDEKQVAEQIEMLSYQVKEIEDAGLKEIDDEDLEKEHAVAANAGRITELANGLANALTEGEASAFDHMVFAQNTLAELVDLTDDAAEWRNEAESIAIQIQELSNSISSHAQGIEADPGRLQWLEDRMALLQKLKRKYGASVPEILAFLDKAKERLNDLENRGERIARLQAEMKKATASVLAAGKKLGKERGSAAKSLGDAITQELRALGFEHGSFEVALSPMEPSPSGLDEVEFGFAPNIGEPMRPLRAIASSGEISRVMLATKAVLAKHDRIPVLIFDEIDANVGGEMGNAIGAKLGKVSRNHQVLCITHLPQVAVHGKHHLVVTKEVSEGRTRTLIRPVDARERTEEVARMLGGKDMTSVTLKHASEMLRNT